MDTQYGRVLPRDLFNESKLLKCFGLLTVRIHDAMAPKGLEFEHDASPFDIALTDDGSLTITNIQLTLNGHYLFFKTTYNSKSNFPFFLEHDDCEYLVFDEQGEFTEEFQDMCVQLASEVDEEDRDHEAELEEAEEMEELEEVEEMEEVGELEEAY
jgi:hypothetical protein